MLNANKIGPLRTKYQTSHLAMLKQSHKHYCNYFTNLITKTMHSIT